MVGHDDQSSRVDQGQYCPNGAVRVAYERSVMKAFRASLVIAVSAAVASLPAGRNANAFVVDEEKTNTCADWLSNTNNENQSRYQWILGFVRGTESTMYPDRRDSRSRYPGSKRVNKEITKHTFINAIDKACKDNPGYPLSDGIAFSIMDILNITPQSRLAQEPYMLEIDVCDGKVEASVGDGGLVKKGVQLIYLDQCSLFAARSSSTGRQILKECPIHSRCHVEGHVPGDSSIEFLVNVERIKTDVQESSQNISTVSDYPKVATLPCTNLLKAYGKELFSGLIDPVAEYIGEKDQDQGFGSTANITDYVLTECRLSENSKIGEAVEKLFEEKRLGQLPRIPIGGATGDPRIHAEWIAFEKWILHKGPRPHFSGD